MSGSDPSPLSLGVGKKEVHGLGDPFTPPELHPCRWGSGAGGPGKVLPGSTQVAEASPGPSDASSLGWIFLEQTGFESTWNIPGWVGWL